MADPKVLSIIDYWGNHEARILEVARRALRMLVAESKLPDNEDILNRKLFFYVHRANRDLLKQNMHLDWPLVYEARNQPVADDEHRCLREDKRPDFQWGIYDHQESDPNKSAKFYVLEAKRLGTPTVKSPGWKLNENYIKNGVIRFITIEWGYGKSCKSGAMIGYIESMDGPDILIEVNKAARANAIPELRLSKAGWRNGDVSSLDNRLVRPDVPPTPFDLRHLWADLRKKSTRTSNVKGKSVSTE